MQRFQTGVEPGAARSAAARFRPASRWIPALGTLLAGLGGAALAVPTRAAVVISEIHYHPVELPAFQASFAPVLDLSEDVHEFVEIHNPDSNAVSLAGWRLTGGIDFTFPSNAVLLPGAFRVLAKNPARLASVAPYGLVLSNLFGPYTNQLGNNGDTVRLRDAAGDTVDSVAYSAQFPWAISADALGADDEWTGLNSSNYQYRGRSLERVSFTHNPNDPANWVASPVGGNPSPGRTNSGARAAPKPVIIAFRAASDVDEAALLRAGQPVRIDCTFSGTNLLRDVAVEWFVDDVNLTTEPRTTNAMALDGPPELGAFTVVLPGQADRSIVRYRFRANRGTGDEAVSPRADDPFAWHACFVTPVRSSTKPIYDCFIASASLTTLGNMRSAAPPSSAMPSWYWWRRTRGRGGLTMRPVGSRSNTACATATPAWPSMPAWCALTYSATWPFLRPSITKNSHSGRLRSSRLECSRATYCCNCRLLPGRGRVTWRTW